MSESILTSTKKILGLEATYTAFDLDIITHINSVFSTLHQLGLGPVDGFYITGPDETWEVYLDNDPRINSVKSYMYIKTRLFFDPPSTSYHVAALEEQAKEFEWRLNVVRENDMMPHPVPNVEEV